MGWVLDMDGVLWLADQPIGGSAAAVETLRRRGEEVVFVTNNSYARRDDVAAKLERHGIEARDDVITSAMAVTSLLEPGERVLVCGGPGISEEVANRGCDVVEVDLDDPAGAPDVDAVVVGFHPEFDYRRMWAASHAVRRGARLLATNSDSTYPTPTGPAPGGGAILASIEIASDTRAQIAGKPLVPIAELVWARLGRVGMVVGDRPETDGEFARTLGFRFGLVLSGVSHDGDVDPVPDLVASNLAELVDLALSDQR